MAVKDEDAYAMPQQASRYGIGLLTRYCIT